MKRIVSLDYLRGVCAFLIMLFHFNSWDNDGYYNSEHFLGVAGKYGVSIFYILSGITLGHLYKDYHFDFSGLKKFFLKRFFRIFPLLYIVIGLTLVFDFLHGRSFHVEKFILNITGLFSIIDPDNYYGNGVWSIGNELFFYLTFPILIITLRWTKWGNYLILVSVLCIYVWFAFFNLTPTSLITEQWGVYVNPLNQWFLFVGGVWVGTKAKKARLTNGHSLILIILGTCGIIYYPAHGDTINILTGINRIVYTIFCLSISFGFYKLNIREDFKLGRPLEVLGHISYSLYLLHSFVWNVVNKTNVFLPEYNVYFSIIASLSVSYISYYFFEKYFIRLGRKLLKKG